jgi:hypothetical protein
LSFSLLVFRKKPSSDSGALVQAEWGGDGSDLRAKPASSSAKKRANEAVRFLRCHEPRKSGNCGRLRAV